MDARVSDARVSDARGSDINEARTWRGWRPERCDQIALVLQGGGALGAYQAGVYQALHEADIEPNFVSGVSIGAINASIIAGNSRRHRLPRLRQFWEMITDRKIWAYTPDGDIYRKARNGASS
jgi:NTE family protein